MRASATERANQDLEVFSSDIEGVAILEGHKEAVGAFDEGRGGADGDLPVKPAAEDAAVAMLVGNKDRVMVGIAAPGAPAQHLRPRQILVRDLDDLAGREH